MRSTTLGNKIVSAMGEFRSQYPVETAELDAAVESADGYRELHQRLTDDDLPRFQQQFKTYLNQNTIRDIAGFQSQLNKQADVIRERIDTINASLVGVDYNPGRYIRLQAQRTRTGGPRLPRRPARLHRRRGVGGNHRPVLRAEVPAGQRIIERFRGREGQTEADRKWTRFVTDVRNWFIFSASERYREDDTEYEHYADSAGKSGGQKEKLAYTILAASLAYQFKLEWGAAKSRNFQFAVIDEAFGRGSDESTRFALELFGRLGLQLLIVTPLQKIHVIEPYVSAVGFVDNPTSGLPPADTDHRGVPRRAARDRTACQLRRRGLTWRAWTRPAERGGSTRMAGACSLPSRLAGVAPLTSRCAARPRPRSAGASPMSSMGRRMAPGQPRPAARRVQAGRRPRRSAPTRSRAGPRSRVTSRPGNSWVRGPRSVSSPGWLPDESRCPRLVPWLERRPVQVLGLAADWAELLATVRWIDERQAPGMYLRQVDVPGVDTKFIERHRGV